MCISFSFVYFLNEIRHAPHLSKRTVPHALCSARRRRITTLSPYRFHVFLFLFIQSLRKLHQWAIDFRFPIELRFVLSSNANWLDANDSACFDSVSSSMWRRGSSARAFISFDILIFEYLINTRNATKLIRRINSKLGELLSKRSSWFIRPFFSFCFCQSAPRPLRRRAPLSANDSVVYLCFCNWIITLLCNLLFLSHKRLIAARFQIDSIWPHEPGRIEKHQRDE